MFGRLDQIIGALAGAAAAGVILLIFFLGVPIGPLKYLPFGLGEGLNKITGGYVQEQRDIARDGYVKEAELAASQATLAETLRQLGAVQKSNEEFAKRLAEDDAAGAAQDAETEKRSREYEQGHSSGDGARFGQPDLDFLRR